MFQTPSNDFKELVRSRTDLVSLIGEAVALQSQGRGQFVGLCPFHDDHRPSMTVYPDRQSFRCWACNTGGDCFQYVMLREGVGFREALELLAGRAHLEVPKGGGQPCDKNDALSKPRLYEVLAWAERQFHEFLLGSPLAQEARDYLAGRGFTAETITQFQLGYHPDNWDWLQGRARGKFTGEQLRAARLVGERSQGSGYHDYFVDRIMFPIRNGEGKTVAFGGRVLPGHANEDRGKYFNSPEGPVFEKSRVLYGLNRAHEGIRRAGAAVVVEGYTDCIMAHQCGITNVVGTLGTALTDANVANLKRLTRKVHLVYDGDRAGRTAAEKSLVRFLAQSVDLRIVTLPGDLDPADAFLKNGRQWFESHVQQAPEVWDYKFRCVVERHGLDSVDGRQRVLEEMLEILSQVPLTASNAAAGVWQVREDLLLGRLSQQLGVPERTLRQGLADLRKERSRRASATTQISTSSSESRAALERLMRQPTKDERIECELLQILLLFPETLGMVQDAVSPAELGQLHLRALYEVCCRLANEEGAFYYDRLMASIEDPELKQLAVYVDEQGREKGIEPGLLEPILKCFQSRRELAPHFPASTSDAPVSGSVPRTPAESKESLRRSAERNLKRVTKA